MSSSPSDLPTCHCGRDRTHHAVHPERKYGFWAWVWLLNGASADAKEITFRCRRCGQVVEVTRDPAVLRQYR